MFIDNELFNSFAKAFIESLGASLGSYLADTIAFCIKMIFCVLIADRYLQKGKKAEQKKKPNKTKRAREDKRN